MSDDIARSPAETANALPAGTRLHEFELLQVLGVGGFGIVYLAFDHALEREVAIKEYMPASMVGRTETMHVSLRSQSDAEVFALGLASFVKEARLLARFDHPSLLKVHRFWEANGTAYMAMPVMRGRTLKQIRQGRQSLENPIDERWLRGLLGPLLGALETLHAAGVYHRDIAPDNILVEADGRPVLLDFGAARRVIGDRTQTLTAILKPAYAPIEQYGEAGSVRQGAWTDLYALGATLHYMLLGRPPEPATTRTISDDELPLALRRVDGCGEAFLRCIDWMLAPRPADRPQSIAALREALEGRAEPPRVRAAPPVAPAQWEVTQAIARPAASASAAPAPAPAAAAAAPPLSGPAPEPAPAAAPAVQPLVAAPAPSGKGRAIGLTLAAVVAVAGAAAVFWPRGEAPPAALTAPAPAPALAAPAPVSSPSPPPAAAEAAKPADAPTAAGIPPATATVTAPSAAPDGPKPPPTAPAAAAPRVNPPAPRPPAAAAAQRVPATATENPGGTTSAPVEPGRPAATAAAPPAPAADPPAVTTPPPASPAQSPPAPEPAVATGPEARCSGRNPLSFFACMERQCLRPLLGQHPDCQKWRREAKRE